MNLPGFTRRGRASAAVVALPDRPDGADVHTLQRRVDGALLARRRPIMIDLLAVSYIDTQTLAELCSALRRLTGRGATIAVVGADARVQWVLELCWIDGVELHPTLNAALTRCPDIPTRASRVTRPGAVAREHAAPRRTTS